MTGCGHIEEFDGMCRECSEKIVKRCQWLEGMVIALSMFTTMKVDPEKLLGMLPPEPVMKP
jgi:hypothetical protein